MDKFKDEISELEVRRDDILKQSVVHIRTLRQQSNVDDRIDEKIEAAKAYYELMTEYKALCAKIVELTEIWWSNVLRGFVVEKPWVNRDHAEKVVAACMVVAEKTVNELWAMSQKNDSMDWPEVTREDLYETLIDIVRDMTPTFIPANIQSTNKVRSAKNT